MIGELLHNLIDTQSADTLGDVGDTNDKFCTVIDPETNKRCGKFMRNWDEMFYEKYGMCEDCYLKYNSHIEEVKQKLDNEVGEVVKEEK